MLEIIPPVLSPSGRQLVMDEAGNEVEVGSIKSTQDNRPILLDPSGNEIKAPRAILHSKAAKTIPAFEQKLNRFEELDRTAIDRSELVQKLVFDQKFVLLDLFGHFVETEQGQADGGVL